MQEEILVMDFGSQYNQLIVRRIRELGVYSELISADFSAEDLATMPQVKGIIFSGGPASVTDPDALTCDPALFSTGIPILGICYGMQLIHAMLGGHVQPGSTREYGRTSMTVTADSPLLDGLPRMQTVWMSHGDQVVTMAPGFSADASSNDCPLAAAHDPQRQIYTVQFHPEVAHTEYGEAILGNFLFKICQAHPEWDMRHFIEQQIEQIRQTVGQDKVLLALSGGVDSAVVGALLHRAIGSQLICMFIDHGLLRKGEADTVMAAFGQQRNWNVIRVDAAERFYDKLKGVTDAEQKRKIIGNEFIAVFQQEVNRLFQQEKIPWLAQGTLYTDVIESGTKTAQTIKSHHNVGGLPKEMPFRLIEPLNTLFKDEVRQLGRELDLPEEIIWRQPFPGPGLAIRILGEVTPEKVRIVQDSDAIVRQEIARAGLQREIWQYFTVLTDSITVGVMGDQRTVAPAIVVRAVTSADGMTADWARIPHEILARISSRIVNEVSPVNRVVYDITSKPPGTIEWQ